MRLKVIPEGAVTPSQVLSVILLIALVVGLYYVSTQITITGNVITERANELSSCNAALSSCKVDKNGFETQLNFKTEELEICSGGLSTCQSSLSAKTASEEKCKSDLSVCGRERNTLNDQYSICSASLETCSSERDTLISNYDTLADSFAKFKCCIASGAPRTKYYQTSGNSVVICVENEGFTTRLTGC